LVGGVFVWGHGLSGWGLGKLGKKLSLLLQLLPSAGKEGEHLNDFTIEKAISQEKFMLPREKKTFWKNKKGQKKHPAQAPRAGGQGLAHYFEKSPQAQAQAGETNSSLNLPTPQTNPLTAKKEGGEKFSNPGVS